MSLILEKLDHVDDDLWLDLLKLILNLLDGVELELAEIKRTVALIVGHFLLKHTVNRADELVAPVEIQDGHILLSRHHIG